jgi:glycolate oxidase FAD binding subunit
MNTTETILARQLAETVGAEHVLEDPGMCAAFAVQGVTPRLVVAPGSVDELGQTLAAAYAAKASVVPWGGSTKQAYGAPPARLDLVVHTARLNSVVMYEPDDLTISVGAGMTMRALRDTLVPHGHMLPVDVALPERATVGGVLATNADGPRRLGYGTLRDLLIGIAVVEATGRVSKAGGMVVKNVSGFDMMKLYLGSLGTLAVIASANFKLLPRPRAAATVVCSFDASHQQRAVADAFQLADLLHQSQLTPVAVEYVSHADASRVVVWCEGLPQSVARQQRDITTLAEQAGAMSVQQLTGTEHERLWSDLVNLPQTATLRPNEVVLRVNCLPSQLGQALGDAERVARQHELALQVGARMLSGVAYLRVEGAEGHATLVRELQARWPHTAVLACDPTLKAQFALWGQPPAGAALMQQIKREFDDQGLLNPGRFIMESA